MELNSLEKLIEKKFDKGIFRRWICLLLAIIMLIPAWGGVLAADVDVDLVNEAYKEIILWKTDISQFRSAIWWTKDGGTKGIDHPIYDEDARTTAFFLSALMEKLNISHTFKANDDNIASGLYTVTATVLGEKYKITIEGTTGENWGSNGKEIWVDIPTDEDAEKLQYQYEINILLEEIKAGLEEKLKNLQSEITDSTATTDPKHAKVTAEKLKEIKAKAVVYGKEIKSYEDKIINITLKAIGVAVLDYNDIDKKISELQIIVEDIENKVIKRGNELPGEINEETKAKLKIEVDEIIISIDKIVKNLVTIEKDLKDSLDLIELEKIKVKIDAYEREVTSHENRVKAIKELPLEVHPDFETIEDDIFKVKENLESVKTDLGKEITEERKNDAKSKIEKAEKDKTNADVTAAKKAVAFLEDGAEKTDFTNRIAYVEQVIKAIAAVDKAVKSNKADDYGVADALVNGTGDPKVGGLDNDNDTAPHGVKDDLNGKLAELKVIIDADAHKKAVADASKLITVAEGNLTKYLNGTIDKATMFKSIQDAKEKVDALDAGDDKDNLSRRLIIVNNRYTELDTAMTAVKSAVDTIEMKFIEGKVDQEDVTNDNVTTINFGATAYKDAVDAGKKANAIGKALNTRIVEINKVLDAIELAKGLNRNTLKTVKTAVAKINTNFSKVKNALNEMIIDLENDIANDNSESLLNAAFTAVTTDQDKDNNAVTSLEIATLIKTAKTLIGKETGNIEKIKLTAVINAIETAQKAKEAVALAGATKLRKDYDKADNLVKSISEDNLAYIEVSETNKPNLVELKSKLNTELAPLLKIINLAEATAAVVKAENSLNQKDYDLAFTAIGKVEGDIADPDTPKGNLKQRLDIVKSVIDATNALAKAVSAVGEAAKASKDLDNSKKITAANTAITDATNAIDEIDENGKYKINRETMTRTVNNLDEIYKALEAVKLLSDVQQELDTIVDTSYDDALSAANASVSKVTDSKVRSDLEAGIKAIEARQDAAGSVKNAEDKLVIAEKLLNDLLLGGGHKTVSESETIYNPVNNLPEFAATIKAVEKAIAEADAEIKVLKDKRSTEFKNRLLAVITAKDVAVLIAKAERDDPSKEPLVKAEVDAATKALPKIIEDIIKDDKTPANIIINHKAIKEYFTSRVKWLNSELVKALQFAEAKKLTDKASQTLADGDIIKAIDYVSKMQNETDRADFNTGNTGRKINGIKNIVDKLAGTVRDKINGAIPLVAVNDKTAAKAVTDAKKSFESFKKIVGEANKKLVGIQENPIVAYKEIYEKPQAGDPKVGGHIPHYNSSLGVLDKSLNIWKLMIAAEKSKKKEDVEAIRKIHLVGMTLEDTVDENGKKTEGIKTLIGSVDPAAMTVHVDLYKSIADGLENKQKELEGYQKGEEGRQEEAQIAINDAKDVLYNYATDKSVGEDVYEIEARKDKVRIDLTIKISSARMAIESIKDAPVKKAKLAELGKIEVYRDAIAAVGNALAYPTQATYKAAESAVKKCSYDYGLVLAELQSELRVINDILDSYAKAEKATKLVEIAEETKLQSDVDKARMAVDMLDDSNPAKIPLGKRLDKVQEFINTKDGVDTAASNTARELLGKALVNITQASRYFNLTALGDKDIRDAYSLLRGEEGKDENGDPIIVAGARHFIRDAISEINKISDILLKETLNRLVIQREEELQNALHEIHIKASERLLGVANEATNERLALATDRSKVESGEWTEKQWTEERLRLEQIARKAIEEARNTIDEMFLPGFMTQKDNLMKWLNQIIGDLANENAEDRYIRAEKMIKEASDAVEKAARSREEADKDKFNIDLKAAKDAIFFAQQAIHAIPEGYNTDKVEGLQKVLDGLQMLWQNISDGVSDEKTIAEARALIEIVKQKLKAWKAGDETEKNVEIAFTIARNKVMGIIDNAKRTELNLELDALEEQFTTDGGQVIIPDDGKNKQSDFDRAKAAVLKAVESRLQKDVDAARKLVAKLVDGPSKDAMNRILDGIIIEKTEEEKRKEEEEKRKEEEAKKKAEEARKKKYPGIDDALNSKDRDKNNPDAKWGKENEFKKK